jgi:predicted nucleic acid-binding Zn ribbon protein
LSRRDFKGPRYSIHAIQILLDAHTALPTYLYKREDGSTFEIGQRITDPALKECPTTGQPVKRLISPGAGLVFKGTGFYLTDYARKDSGASGASFPDREKDGKSPKEEGASSGSPDSSSDSGSADGSSKSASSDSSSSNSSGSSSSGGTSGSAPKE